MLLLQLMQFLQRTSSVDIDVKSKNEQHLNVIPKELYCTYIYKMHVSVKGLQHNQKQPYSLVAFVQVSAWFFVDFFCILFFAYNL